jgi:hypothetical protein
MFEVIAQQNPIFNHIPPTAYNSEFLFARNNGVKVTIKRHPQAKAHQRFSVGSEFVEYGSSYSIGNRRSETSYRQKKTSKRFANLDDAIAFALTEIN